MFFGNVVVVVKSDEFWVCLCLSMTKSNVIIKLTRYDPDSVVFWKDQFWLSESDVVHIKPDSGTFLKNSGIQSLLKPNIFLNHVLSSRWNSVIILSHPASNSNSLIFAFHIKLLKRFLKSELLAISQVN